MRRSSSFLVTVTLAALSPGAHAICDVLVEDCVIRADPDLRITGDPDPYGAFGSNVGLADFDADGTTDLLLGALYDASAHIVYGPASGNVRASSGANLHYTGQSWQSSGLGAAVAAGDANGDGMADAIVAAPAEPSERIYLFLGPITGSRGTDVADAVLVGPTGANHDQTGITDLVAPDLDGDGWPDIAVGATRYKERTRLDGVGRWRGVVYVVPGDVIGTIDLEADATYTYAGVRRLDEIGRGLQTVGDWNGDGVDDLALGGWRAGAVYVIDGGGPPGAFDVDLVASAQIGEGFESNCCTYFGSTLAAGDYDGDGTSDLFVGATGADGAEGTGVGTITSFYGPLTGDVPVSAADVTWEGEAGLGLGDAVAVGDLDGDDASDVILTGGNVYLQLGATAGTVSVGDLPRFRPTSGYRGTTVAAIPDWTGDGGAELLMGAPDALNDAGQNVGAVYVFFSDSLF